MKKKWEQWQIFFSWAPKSLQTVTATMKLKDSCSLEEKLWQIKQCIRKQRHHFADKGPYSQGYGLSSSHIQMWKKKAERRRIDAWILVLEKVLENPLDNKEIKPVNSEGNQPRIFIGRTGAEAEAPILWLPEAKSQLIGKDHDAGKDGAQEEKRAAEDKMVGWHHWLNEHEFDQTLGDSGGQRSLECCSPWRLKELDMT